MKQLVIGILATWTRGKPPLSEALLYTAGAIPALGRVDHRDAYLDTHALERDRGITIFSKQAVLKLPGAQLTLLDTPRPCGLLRRDGKEPRQGRERQGRLAQDRGRLLSGFAASLEQAEKNMEGKKVKVPDEPSSEVCDLCGRPMVIKVGKYGKFLACSGFPECRGTKRLVKDTGGICPKCGKGRMLERKSAKGRIYYGCERYPDCDFMTWDTPVPTKCESAAPPSSARLQALLRQGGCGFEMPVPKKE